MTESSSPSHFPNAWNNGDAFQHDLPVSELEGAIGWSREILFPILFARPFWQSFINLAFFFAAHPHSLQHRDCRWTWTTSHDLPRSTRPLLHLARRKYYSIDLYLSPYCHFPKPARNDPVAKPSALATVPLLLMTLVNLFLASGRSSSSSRM